MNETLNTNENVIYPQFEDIRIACFGDILYLNFIVNN